MNKPDTLSRRLILAGVAAAIPAAAVARPIINIADLQEAELLELGRKLDVAAAKARAFRPASDAADAERSAIFDEHRHAFNHASWLDRKARNGGQSDPDHSNWSALYKSLCGEQDKIICCHNDLMQVADQLADDILKRPARTIAGLGVHARALAWTICDAWDGPIEDADYDRAAVRYVVENLCALAGVSHLPDLTVTAKDGGAA